MYALTIAPATRIIMVTTIALNTALDCLILTMRNIAADTRLEVLINTAVTTIITTMMTQPEMLCKSVMCAEIFKGGDC